LSLPDELKRRNFARRSGDKLVRQPYQIQLYLWFGSDRKPPIPVACQPSFGKGAVRGLLLTRLADPFPARNEINGELLKRAKLSPCVVRWTGKRDQLVFRLRPTSQSSAWTFALEPFDGRCRLVARDPGIPLDGFDRPCGCAVVPARAAGLDEIGDFLVHPEPADLLPAPAIDGEKTTNWINASIVHAAQHSSPTE